MIKASLALSDVLRNYWWLLGLALGLLVMLLFALRKTPAFQSGWHRLMIGMPGLRDITRARFELQFFETLGSLLRGGVPLLPALELVRRAVTNLHLKHSLTQAEALASAKTPATLLRCWERRRRVWTRSYHAPLSA